MTKQRLAIGAVAPDFNLPGVDGRELRLSALTDPAVVVVLFTCNHCPYVQAYEERLIAIQRDFSSRGVQLVAINANETENYPEDDLPNMIRRAETQGFNFHYLRDETQAIADAYGAHYTPEVFLLDADRRLRYTGCIDNNWRSPAEATVHNLRDAIDAVLAGQTPAMPETQAIGCTIKWAKG